MDAENGEPLFIDSVWALGFGSGTTGLLNELFFTSGPHDENNGLFGKPAACPKHRTAWRHRIASPESDGSLRHSPGSTVSCGFPVPREDRKNDFCGGGRVFDAGLFNATTPRPKPFEPFLDGISAQDEAFSTRRHVGGLRFLSRLRLLTAEKLDGSDKLQLSSPPIQAFGPRWSPDGKEIAYFGLEAGKPARIYKVACGGARRRN